MTAIACGSAMTGARAYTYSIGNFPTLRCLEQLRNDVCYHHSNVTVVAVGGGFSYGQLGVSHFATEDLAIMRSLPGMTVVAPSDPWQAHELTHAAPCAWRSRLFADRQGLGGACRRARSSSARSGRSATGAMRSSSRSAGSCRKALAAAETLAGEGIEVRIVDVHTIKPLDVDGDARGSDENAAMSSRSRSMSSPGAWAAPSPRPAPTPGSASRASTESGLAMFSPMWLATNPICARDYGLDAASVASVIRQAIAR